jgi:hypothetical protein
MQPMPQWPFAKSFLCSMTSISRVNLVVQYGTGMLSRDVRMVKDEGHLKPFVVSLKECPWLEDSTVYYLATSR